MLDWLPSWSRRPGAARCRHRQYSRALFGCTWNPLRKGYKRGECVADGAATSRRKNGLEEACVDGACLSGSRQIKREPEPSWLVTAEPSPLPACGERGGGPLSTSQNLGRSPLTPTLSPQAGRGSRKPTDPLSWR